jgi:HEAT repeat protein
MTIIVRYYNKPPVCIQDTNKDSCLKSPNLLHIVTMKDAIRQRIDVLIPLLKDPEPEVRTAAARAIEQLEVTCDINDILRSLKTGDTGTRISSIYALGKIGGEKVIAPLVYCASRPETDIRSAAVEMLGTLADPSTLPTLLERLDDQSRAVQGRAIIALSKFSASPGLYERLRPFLKADNGELEGEAALALAQLGDVASTVAVTALLTSPHVSTRKAAATALSLLPF